MKTLSIAHDSLQKIWDQIPQATECLTTKRPVQRVWNAVAAMIAAGNEARGPHPVLVPIAVRLTASSTMMWRG